MSLGERIQNLRKEKNYSQEMLAEQLEISRQAISKWEGDQVLPEIDNLIKLSKIFKVSIDYLLTGQESIFIEKVAKTNYQIDQKTTNIISIIASSATILFIFIASLYWLTN